MAERRVGPHRDIPIYAQIAEILRGRITDGTYPPGGQLPTEACLAAELGVGKMALRRAFATIRDEGLIVTMRGKRATVRESLERRWTGLSSGSISARMPTPAEQREFALPTGVPIMLIRHDDGSTEIIRADQQGIRVEESTA